MKPQSVAPPQFETRALNLQMAGGWIASSVALGASPIMLLTFKRGPVEKHARVDLDKRILLDEVPFELTDQTKTDLWAKLREFVLQRMQRQVLTADR